MTDSNMTDNIIFEDNIFDSKIINPDNIINFKLKNTWVLWFHKLNDNTWGINSYEKILELKEYNDVLFMLKKISNINCGMFFIMKENIKPIYEDIQNIHGGYWSLRITKKESDIFWRKFIFYLCIDKITKTDADEMCINGLSISPKVNNNIFKIWNNNFKKVNKACIRKDLDFIHPDDFFYLEHKENK